LICWVASWTSRVVSLILLRHVATLFAIISLIGFAMPLIHCIPIYLMRSSSQFSIAQTRPPPTKGTPQRLSIAIGGGFLGRYALRAAT